MELAKLLKQANTGYPNGFLSNYFNEKTGKAKRGSGDTLAEFIVREISETFDPAADDVVQLAEARRVMDKAVNDIRGVLKALDNYGLQEPVFVDGVPHCPHCQSTEFSVAFTEDVARYFGAGPDDGGWGDSEGGNNNLEGVSCRRCDKPLKLSDEFTVTGFTMTHYIAVDKQGSIYRLQRNKVTRIKSALTL